jgi:hypothetical protein
MFGPDAPSRFTPLIRAIRVKAFVFHPRRLARTNIEIGRGLRDSGGHEDFE